MENAGNDIWQEILKRVPAITLGQCMCVCKSWYSLILSPHFIASHLNTQTQTHPHFTLFRDFTSQKPRKEIYRLVFNSDPGFKTCRSFPCPIKVHQRGLYFRVVGTLDGLIFLSDDLYGSGHTFILWNPLVRKCVLLPQPKSNFSSIGAHVSASGFGYDSVTDDYKVVRLCYPQDRDGMDVTPPFVELYSVKERDWRRVNAEGVCYCIADMDWYQCFLRGAVHWVAFDRREVDRGFKCSLVLLFDVQLERFKRMKLPPPLAEANPYLIAMCEFRGMLSVMHHQRDSTVGDLTCFNLWVKKQYNDGKSWSKMFSIDEELGIQKVLHMKGNGQMFAFVAINEKPRLVCYNPGTKEMVHLSGEGTGWSFFAASFTESLVFLGSDTPVVSSEEDHIRSHNSRGGVANVEKEDARGSRSEEDNTPCEQMEMMASVNSVLRQMKKFRHDF